MGTPAAISRLADISERYRKIDRAKLVRGQLGALSIRGTIEPVLAGIDGKLETILEFAPQVSDALISSVINNLEPILSSLTTQAGLDDGQYGVRRDSFLANIKEQAGQLSQSWLVFFALKAESQGALDGQRLDAERAKLTNQFTAELRKLSAETEKRAGDIVARAQTLANQIEKGARATAAKISVEIAQEQFRDGAQQCKNRAKGWAFLAVAGFASFFGLAFHFYTIELPPIWSWQIAYYSALRLTILTTIVAMATFCLRIVRSNMHMQAHYEHRGKIANSMAAFVESASLPEHRDLILTRLVEAVSEFGSTGLLDGEKVEARFPSLSIETLSKQLSPSASK